jgi:hypothetical protein
MGRKARNTRKAGKTRCGTWFGPGVLALIVLVWAVPAGAVTVVIVRLRNPPVLTKETLVRVALELRSVGFETELVDAPTAGGENALAAAPWLSPVATSNRADALLVLVGEVAPVAVEVRAIDRRTGRSVVHRMPLDGTSERTPETLAIRAMELLRSSLIELDLMPDQARETTTQPAAASAPSPPNPAPGVAVELFAVEVGVAALMSPGGVGPAVLPVLRLDLALGSSLLVRTAAAGLGTRGPIETKTGTAQIAEEQVLLGAVYRLRVGKRLRPFVALSAGALHLSVEGWADPPNQGRRTGRWSLLIDGGLGAFLGLRDRFYVAAAANVQVAEPYVAIRFLDAVVATTARPNLLLAVTVGAWL